MGFLFIVFDFLRCYFLSKGGLYRLDEKIVRSMGYREWWCDRVIFMVDFVGLGLG